MVINFEGIPIYGICILLSLLANVIGVYIIGKKNDVKQNILVCSIIYECLGIIIGGKLLNMIQISENKSFYYAGFSSYGGVIGGIFSIFLFYKFYKLDIKNFFSFFVVVLPLVYSISKLGCFFAGCCYGIEYNGIGSIIYKKATEAPTSVSLFPVQIVESMINLIIFICIVKKCKINNYVSNVFIFCGLFKFALEFLRASWIKVSLTQWISIVFIVVGIFLKFHNKKMVEKE